MERIYQFSTLFFALLVGITFTACDLTEERGRTFEDLNDDSYLEFKPQSEVVDEGAGTVTTEIQLIGPQRDSDLQVDFELLDESTAEEGVHYELNSTTATIAAGSSSTDVSLEVLDNDMDDGDTVYELLLELQEAEDVEPAENLKTYTLSIEGQDE